jgi:hypothetical protein
LNPDYGGGDGEKYMQFIVETLKPYVDQHYRTLPDRENTGIMGSSLGGLISHFGALKYQSVFGKAGIFSPSYWFSDSVWKFTHDAGKQNDMRIYQLCGTDESSEIDVPGDMYRMNDSLVKLGFAQENISNKVVAGGQHNEKLWSEAFSEAYQWLFNDYITSVADPVQDVGITCYPNPVTNELTFKSTRKIHFDTLVIMDINGKVVKSIKAPANNKLDVRNLKSGSYILRCTAGDVRLEGKFIKK